MNLVNSTEKIKRFLRNRRLKRLFYEEYADDEKWQQLVAKLPTEEINLYLNIEEGGE